MTPLLVAQGISKSFIFKGKRTFILEDLNLCISEHEFVTIIGSSGCGKSTLLELFAGITSPDAGTIIYEGKVINGNGGYLGYMPQDDLLFPWLTTVQNALLPVRVRKGNINTAKAVINDLLPAFGLQEHAGHLPYQLSGGLKQRVSLLRTYMTESKVLLLDEPFANLDALTRLQMQDWLLDIKQRLDLTVLMVTHDIREAIRLSSRILLMDKNPGRFTEEFAISPELERDPLEQDKLYKQIVTSL